MKTLAFLISAFILSNLLNAQNHLIDILPSKDGKIFYTDVVQIDNVSKIELYKRAKNWLADVNEIVILDDIDKDKLVARGFFSSTIWHTVKIQMKDGKYKYEITNLREKRTLVGSDKAYYEDISFEDRVDYIGIGARARAIKDAKKIDSVINAYIERLINAMKAPIDNDW